MKEWNKVVEDYTTQLNNILSSELCYFHNTKGKDIPNKSGVYTIFDKNSEVLYVGQSKRLKGRLIDDHLHNDKIGSAFRRNLSEYYNLTSEKEIKEYILKNCSFRYLQLDKPKLLEHFAICVLRPRLNK